MKNKGFTLIELLIVIALIGILAVALLSAINPVEQTKKARDAGRKSDAAELLNAEERYYATFGCYSWENLAGGCTGTATTPSVDQVLTADFNTGQYYYELINKEEIKSQFSGRTTISKGELFLTESTIGQVSVCFSPESKTARGGGLGPIRNQTNSLVGTCGATYNLNDPSCNVCVPQ